MIAIIPIATGQPLDLAPDAEFEKFFKGLRGLRLDERVPSQGKALIDGGLTEAEAKEANKAQFERNERILVIRRKYYDEYSKFLTQKQIQRVYEIEKQMHGKMAGHGRKGGPGRGAGRGPERGPRPGGQK